MLIRPLSRIRWSLWCARQCSSTADVRVRFAPSPTGQLHLGGLRTALYNYLFARHHKGQFLLRVEDTDRTRFVEGSEENMQNVLAHYGLSPDEGPAQGGPVGPYRQSERLPIYTEHMERLIDSGHAYRCFCTEQRLDLLRKEALRQNAIPKYDGRCRRISTEEGGRRAAAGQPHVVRFKLDKTNVGFEVFEDRVYGAVSQTLDESDFVLVKSDGFPTYHFASVVDDRSMRISHVIRGMEWLSSTGKHVILYKAFGWPAPSWVHLPLMTRDGKRKLSKRDADAFAHHYNHKLGALPHAVLNFLLRNGSGIADFDPTRLYSLQELIEQFDETTIGRRNLQLDEESLQQYSRLAFRYADPDRLYEMIVERVRRDMPTVQEEALSRDNIDRVVSFLREKEERFAYLSQLTTGEFSFFFGVATGPEKVLDKFDKEVVKKVLDSVLSRDSDWELDWLKRVASDAGLPYPKMLQMLRLVLIDCAKGPPIMELVEFFGKDGLRERVERMRGYVE